MSSTVSDDARWMQHALHLAERGWGRVAPNPLVGAVLVRDGVVVGEGWHAEYGGPHAEVRALAEAGDAARGATLYVTLEPCAHTGKTPPCVDAVLRAGVARVVIGAPDPNPRAAGGAARLRDAGVQVDEALRGEAEDVDPAFFHRFRRPEGPPFIALKLALSLDARIADAWEGSTWITGEAARAEVHRLRAGFDAIAVGIGTVLADDPLLTVRGPVQPRVHPTRVVWDRRLRLPLSSRLVASVADAPLCVVTALDAPAERERALEQAGVQVLRAGDAAEALIELRARGIGSLFVEGGAGLSSALLGSHAVDRLLLFYAPLLIGPGGASPFSVGDAPLGDARRWRTLGTRRLDSDVMITLAAE